MVKIMATMNNIWEKKKERDCVWLNKFVVFTSRMFYMHGMSRRSHCY